MKVIADVARCDGSAGIGDVGSIKTKGQIGASIGEYVVAIGQVRFGGCGLMNVTPAPPVILSVIKNESSWSFGTLLL